MEFPKLGFQSELQLPAYTTATATPEPSQVCDLHHSAWQRQILNPNSLFFLFFIFRATPEAYGGYPARDPIRATAASLHHSPRNAGSKPLLQPAPQLMAMPDPRPTE